MRWVECVPNFSEGRRPEVVQAIADAIEAVPDCRVLDREMDAAHHRSVVTFVAPPERAVEAAFRAVECASRHIDLTTHKGEHPRMGAADVVPFVPLAGVSLDECVKLAVQLAERIGRELSIPAYLYAAAARTPDRKRLPDVRKGEFEGLRTAIEADPARAPDFGPRKIHPTAGATAVGARDFLIAFNVNLDSPDVELAKRIAGELRESSGGLPSVQAKGFEVEVDGKRIAQVSINLLDFKTVDPYRATAEVERRAAAAGVTVRETEVVGLIPREAVVRSALSALRLRNFHRDQILEEHLEKAGLDDRASFADSVRPFLIALASPTPTPGGGTAAAMAGATGASLAAMVLTLTAQKKTPEEARPMLAAAEEARMLMDRLLSLMDADAGAYDRVVKAMALPKATPEEKAERQKRVQEALAGATETPLETMEESLKVLKVLRTTAQLGSTHALSDVGVGMFAAGLGVRGGGLNVDINTGSLKDPGLRGRYDLRKKELLAAASRYEQEIQQILQARLQV